MSSKLDRATIERAKQALLHLKEKPSISPVHIVQQTATDALTTIKHLEARLKEEGVSVLG